MMLVEALESAHGCLDETETERASQGMNSSRARQGLPLRILMRAIQICPRYEADSTYH